MTNLRDREEMQRSAVFEDTQQNSVFVFRFSPAVRLIEKKLTKNFFQFSWIRDKTFFVLLPQSHFTEFGALQLLLNCNSELDAI